MELRGHEAEDADAPRRVADAAAVSSSTRGPVGSRQREGEERQPACVCHRLGEGGPVADPRHRPLHHRQAECQHRLDSREYGVPNAAHRGTDGPISLQEPRRQVDVLPDRSRYGDTAPSEGTSSVHHSGLGPVGRPHQRCKIYWRLSLWQERQLRVQHDARRTTDHGRGSSARSDAAPRPHWQVEVVVPEQLLQEDERAELTDPATCLMSACE